MTEAKSVLIDAIKMVQPMGTFYLGVMEWRDLRQLSFVDMRRIENDLDNYIGIQRKLNDRRVEEIRRYVRTIDATFPTSVVLSIPGECAEYDEDSKQLKIVESLDKEDEKDIPFHEIAKVLDGQHRIEGLDGLRESDQKFDVPVTVIVDADIADQAYIFATVNLAQTKVNKSLVYDLLDYQNARSPAKTCHEIVVALNQKEGGPFFRRIKRLGSSTPGVIATEFLTQATFVNALLAFISKDPTADRDILMRGKKLKPPTDDEHRSLPFRRLFIGEQDSIIARNVSSYFHAIRDIWPRDWLSDEKGNILPRTNGFRAFIQLLKPIYVHLQLENPSTDEFFAEDYSRILSKVTIGSGEFNSNEYLPGTSGEKKLYRELLEQTEMAPWAF